MKRYKSLVFSMAVLAGVLQQSCTKNFLDYNTDGRGATPEEVQRDGYILTSALTGLQAWVVPLDVNTNQFVECLLGGSFSGYLADSNNGFNGKNFASYNPENGWARVAFNDIIPNIIIRHKKVKSVTNELVPIAVADVIKVMAISRVTDIYGPIPYSKIGENGALEAPYDSQEEVYDKLFEELNAAIKVLSENLQQNFSPKADNVYAGNVTKWLKLANSLKLRLAMRISNVSPQKAKEMGEQALQQSTGLIVANADNAFVKPINRNPFRVIMYEYNNGDSRVSADITSFMNGYADPRREKYFTPSAFTTGTNGFFGLRSGIQIPSGNNIKLYTNMKVDESDNILWMNAAEVAFLKSEAALRGWQGVGGTAQSNYEEGIKLSFEQWGASGAESYLANTSNRPDSYVDPMGQFSYTGTPSRITINWSESATQAEKMERIITQKWIANFPLGIEAWSEYRRTGYPKLMEVMQNNSGGLVSTSRMARRLAYPQEEYTENSKNVNDAVTNMLKGADNMGTDVWWAKK